MNLTWYNMGSKTRSPAQIKFYFEPKHYGTGQNVCFNYDDTKILPHGVRKQGHLLVSVENHVNT